MEEIAQEHQHEDHATATKAMYIAIIIFSIGFMISEPNLDGFNLEEALEFIRNSKLESVPIHIAGFVTSFIANIPLLAAIIYRWLTQKNHHGHHHSMLELVIEALMIGIPFGLMGTAAYLDTVRDFTGGKELTILQKVFVYCGAAISGLLTAIGAYKLHAFHAHGAMEEGGGGLLGFFKSIYTTFGPNVWRAKDSQPTFFRKIFAVINEAWKKYGIVIAHGLLGSFAANVFLKETGLQEKIPLFDLALKILLPTSVMLYEGNTEARSLDEYQRRLERGASYSAWSRGVVIFSAILHTIPIITVLAIFMGNTHQGPFNGLLFNLLIFMAAALFIAYPSVYGYTATAIKGYDKAVRGLNNWFYETNQEESAAINKSDRPTFSAQLMYKVGFMKQPFRRPMALEEVNGNYQNVP